MSSTTTQRTIWTSTLLDVLYRALQAQKNDATLLKAADKLMVRGMTGHYLLRKVEEAVSPAAASRLRTVLTAAGRLGPEPAAAWHKPSRVKRWYRRARMHVLWLTRVLRRP